MDAGQIDIGNSFDNTEVKLPESLPQLKGGWYVLVYPLAIKAELKTKSGISFILPENVVESHNALITAGIVVDMGPLAYKHEKYRHPETGEYMPWCAIGDYVVFSRASMSTSVIHGDRKFYVMPDQSILYTVEKPSDITPHYTFEQSELDSIQKQIADYHERRKLKGN